MITLTTLTLPSAPIGIWLAAIASMVGFLWVVYLAHIHRQDRNRWKHVRPSAPILDARAARLQASRAERLVAPAVDAFASAVQRLVRPSWVSDSDLALERAGPRRYLNSRRLIALKAFLLPVGIAVGFLASQGNSSDTRVLAMMIAPLLTWRIPGLYLTQLADRRSREVTRQLPDVLDQITIAVGAGLGLEAAMTRVSQRTRGALGDELNRTMQDIRIGIRRATAYEGLARRTSSEDLKALARALVQGIEMGVPLGPVLRARATDLRRKRRAAAEERAHKLSVKLSFPTALCILPAMLMLIVGPAILEVLTTDLGG